MDKKREHICPDSGYSGGWENFTDADWAVNGYCDGCRPSESTQSTTSKSTYTQPGFACGPPIDGLRDNFEFGTTRTGDLILMKLRVKSVFHFKHPWTSYIGPNDSGFGSMILVSLTEEEIEALKEDSNVLEIEKVEPRSKERVDRLYDRLYPNEQKTVKEKFLEDLALYKPGPEVRFPNQAEVDEMKSSMDGGFNYHVMPEPVFIPTLDTEKDRRYLCPPPLFPNVNDQPKRKEPYRLPDSDKKRKLRDRHREVAKALQEETCPVLCLPPDALIKPEKNLCIVIQVFLEKKRDEVRVYHGHFEGTLRCFRRYQVKANKYFKERYGKECTRVHCTVKYDWETDLHDSFWKDTLPLPPDLNAPC